MPLLNEADQRTLCELTTELGLARACRMPPPVAGVPDPLAMLVFLELVERGLAERGAVLGARTSVRVTSRGQGLAETLQGTYTMDLESAFVLSKPGRITGMISTTRIEYDDGEVQYATRLTGRDATQCKEILEGNGDPT